MSTYFDVVKKSYADVPIEGGIDTAAFLEATEGLVKLFDLLGNSAFTIVQNDISGNIKKLNDRLTATGPQVSGTLQNLVQNEGKPGDKKRPATEGLLWLLRTLDFTSKALRRSCSNPSEELSVSFTHAYDNSLKKHHSFVIRPLFGLAMKACPYRKDFYAKLGSPPERVREELEKWLCALEKIVKTMQDFYEQGNYSKGF